MCGIYFTLTTADDATDAKLPPSHLEQMLINRGPDLQNRIVLDNVAIAGYVLWQQGYTPAAQPIQRANKFLLFNGDLFNLDAVERPVSRSDTDYLMQQLFDCECEADILEVFSKIEGPYSLVFLDISENYVYFARDALGRNSLIIERIGNVFRLSSTTTFDPDSEKMSMELPSIGVYKMAIDGSALNCELYPWNTALEQLEQHAEALWHKLCLNVELMTPIELQFTKRNKYFPVKFDFYEIVEKIMAKNTEEFGIGDHEKASELNSKTIHEHSLNLTTDSICKELLNDQAVYKALQAFSSLLEDSVRQRVQLTPSYCINCLTERLQCMHAKVAILFSGGIDCSILAKLVDRYTPPEDEIELINVAFERVSNNSNKNALIDWDVPDRVTARLAYEELQTLCPLRQWNFIEVNVTRDELQEQLTTHIKHLIFPLNSVLDESLGAAFWFAARGNHVDGFEVSSARVVIVGSGADELFGGYSRHRNAYKRHAGSLQQRNEAVLKELERDWQRLPSRNLARDDRVIADHGKTVRAPYIEERISHFVRSLTANQRSCYELPHGLGDKLFLRLYGYHLGLRVSVDLKKRAIQFGSRIANKNQNAKDESEYLKYT